MIKILQKVLLKNAKLLKPNIIQSGVAKINQMKKNNTIVMI